jgi:hypothetical protein
LAALYVADTQRAYTDSLGNLIPSQGVEIGQLIFGLDIARPVTIRQVSWMLEVGLHDIYSYSQGSGFASTVVQAADGLRGRAAARLSKSLKNGGQLFFAGHYDGIGNNAYEAYGLDVGLEVQF